MYLNIYYTDGSEQQVYVTHYVLENGWLRYEERGGKRTGIPSDRIKEIKAEPERRF